MHNLRPFIHLQGINFYDVASTFLLFAFKPDCNKNNENFISKTIAYSPKLMKMTQTTGNEKNIRSMINLSECYKSQY